ncbi:hypothetical protein SLA2020_503330 [Shorea laevis]
MSAQPKALGKLKSLLSIFKGRRWNGVDYVSDSLSEHLMWSQKHNSNKEEDAINGPSNPTLYDEQEWEKESGPPSQTCLGEGVNWATKMGLDDEKKLQDEAKDTEEEIEKEDDTSWKV